MSRNETSLEFKRDYCLEISHFAVTYFKLKFANGCVRNDDRQHCAFVIYSILKLKCFINSAGNFGKFFLSIR